MTTDTATANSESRPAVEGPVERRVRALDPEREAFELWLNPGRHAGNVSPWVEPGRYEKETHQLAWLAWKAARPKRPAVGAIVNVAAELAQRKPLRALDPLTEASRIGRLQMARAYAQADEDTRLLAIKLADAVRAL